MRQHTRAIKAIDRIEDDADLLKQVKPLWNRLSVHNFCPFCGCDVEQATFPWRFRSHDIHGTCGRSLPTCAGSRNVYTLEMLGIGDAFLATGIREQLQHD